MHADIDEIIEEPPSKEQTKVEEPKPKYNGLRDKKKAGTDICVTNNVKVPKPNHEQ